MSPRRFRAQRALVALSRYTVRLICLLAYAVLAPSGAAGQDSRDALAIVQSRMSVEEKFWQLFMLPGSLDDPAHDYSHGVFGLQVPPAETARADAVRINTVQRYFVEETRLGIPIIPFEEAVHGLRRPGATMFPQAIALAATWDTVLVRQVARAIARETRSRGIRQVLSPVVNIASDVRWGRVEETYGEDPYLASAMTRAYVTALESAGVITTPKHFVANVGEGGRDSWPIGLDQRSLTEVHYPPFRAALDAGSRSIMTAYNAVNGVPATQNRTLLTDILKRAWGFSGFVISDASGTGGPTVLHLTEPDTPTAAQHAFEAGLDVVFQSSWPEHRPYLQAIRENRVSSSVVDSAVVRVLTAKQALGLFEAPYADPDSADYWNGHRDHRALARRAAAASMVLLKNENTILPLSSSISNIAVIGADAEEARLGGYSSTGIAPVSILDGLRERLGERIQYSVGPGRRSVEYVTVPSEHLALTATFFDNPRLDGPPRIESPDEVIDERWTFNPPARGLTPEWYSVRWAGALNVGSHPPQRLGLEGDDGWRLYLDDSLLIDNWEKISSGTHTTAVTLEPGGSHDLTVEYFATTGDTRLRLVWDAGVQSNARARIDSAAALAGRSDIAVVVVGLEEGEFRDRAFLNLPGYQDELVNTVAATGTPTIVIIVGGSAVTMPWLEDVDAVLMAWYPGEVGGRALADVLFGDTNPAGRLPITFPIAEGQLPLVYNHGPTGRGNDYVDLTGRPLFPFGFGQSYTTFAYTNLRVTPRTIGPNDTATVQLRVRNTGTRAGDEVVQLYVRDPLATVVRPVLSLAGFVRISLLPGEEREVEFRLGPDQLGLIDRNHEHVVEPGTFNVYIGASSRDLRLRGEIVVQ